MRNDKEIETYLKSKYQKNHNYATILKILQNIPHEIEEYIKFNYKKHK